MKKTLFILIVLMQVMLKSYSQDYISKHEAIEDIDYFFNHAELIHPNLYFKISKSDLSTQIAALKNDLNDSISVIDFSKKMRVLVNHIGDGHTQMRLSDAFYDEYQEAACRFPFKLKVKNEELIISETKTDLLTAGDKILAINNIEPKKLLDLKKYPIVDLESFREIYFERSFSFYVFLEYGFTEKAMLKIERNGSVINQEITLLKQIDKDPIPDYTYKTISDKVGVLQLNTFSGIDTKNYADFLDSTLFQLTSDSIELLIIDLRNNGGGNTICGTILLPYIDVTNYKFTQQYQIKTSKPAKDFIKENYVKWYVRPLALFSKVGRAYLYKKDGSITDFDLAEQKLTAIKNPYKNKVCVLTSNDTYSAAADFVGAFSYAQRGLRVGEIVGQPYSGYIDQISVKLPNSNLDAGVSFKKYEFVGATESNKLQGIAPDIFIDLKNIESESEIYKTVISKIQNANNISNL